MAAELSPEEREKLELERLEDLIASAKALADRAVERLGIESANFHRLRVLAGDARIILTAAVAVLDRL